MRKNSSKIMISTVIIVLLLASIALASGFVITGKVIEISPTSIAEYPTATSASVPGASPVSAVLTTAGKPMPAACVDKCGDGICQEVVCAGTGCPCPETPASCPGDCGESTSVCGNGICEKGEATVCALIQCISEPCPQPPCKVGTCPKDCELVDKCPVEQVICEAGTEPKSYMGSDGCEHWKCVPVEPPKPVCTPVCKAMGSRSEGWYDSCTGKLIQYDNCACVAVCKGGVGGGYGTVRHEGYYSSCTGELILQADCSQKEPIKIEIKERTVEIKQVADQGVVLIESEATAITKEKLIVVEGSLGMSTSTGVKQIAYLPEEAKQKAIQVKGLTEVTGIELVQEEGKPVYQVEGKTKSYFLWTFPTYKSQTVQVDASTNEVIQ